MSATNFDKVVALAKEGLTQPEISMELGVNRSNVSRAARKAIEEGKIVNIATRRGKNQHTKPWHDERRGINAAGSYPMTVTTGQHLGQHLRRAHTLGAAGIAQLLYGRVKGGFLVLNLVNCLTANGFL